MSTFCPLITTRAASFCKRVNPARQMSCGALNIVVAGDGKLSVPGAKPAQYFAILLRCGKPRAAAGKIACEADDIRALRIHNAHQPPQPGCVCTILQVQVCQVCHAQRGAAAQGVPRDSQRKMLLRADKIQHAGRLTFPHKIWRTLPL